MRGIISKLVMSGVISGAFCLPFTSAAFGSEIPAPELAAIQAKAAEGMSAEHKLQVQDMAAQMESLSAQMDDLNTQMVAAQAKGDLALMEEIQKRTLRLSQASQTILLQMNSDDNTQLAQSY